MWLNLPVCDLWHVTVLSCLSFFYLSLTGRIWSTLLLYVYFFPQVKTIANHLDCFYYYLVLPISKFDESKQIYLGKGKLGLGEKEQILHLPNISSLTYQCQKLEYCPISQYNQLPVLTASLLRMTSKLLTNSVIIFLLVFLSFPIFPMKILSSVQRFIYFIVYLTHVESKPSKRLFSGVSTFKDELVRMHRCYS